MARDTGIFQQRALQEKLRRLEEEIASTKAAAEEMARKALERSAQAQPERAAPPPEASASAEKPKA